MASRNRDRREAAKRHVSIFIGLVGLAFALTAFFGFFFAKNLYLNLLLVPGVLIVCMWCYKSYCCDTLELSDEETGDSLYYLGFLFTAAALAAGILVIGFKLQGRGGAAGDDVVVSFLPSFAVALVTTIVGLCWRVVLSLGAGDVLSQAADDIDTAYSGMKDQLLDVASDLTEQANLTTEQFQILLTILRQKTQEVEQEFKGFSDSMTAAFSLSGMQGSAAVLRESAETLDKAAEAMVQSSREAESRLESAIEALAAAARQMNAAAAAQAQAMQDVSALAADIKAGNQNLLTAIKQESQEVRQNFTGFTDLMTAALSQGGVEDSAKESLNKCTAG